MSRLPDPFVDNSAPGFTGARLVDNNPVIYDEMPSGKVLRVKTSSQFWSLELSYPELFYTEYAYLASFVAEAQRTNSTIDVLLPHYENYNTMGTPNGCTIAAGQEGSTITLGNVDGNILSRPHLNDLFKLSVGSKVYKITSFVHDVPNNEMVLGLYPDLAHTTDGTEKPVFNNILFNMVLQDDAIPVEDPDVDGLYRGFTLALRESIDG